ncbi:MAG TPA: CDP-alcohol phosphatidyltransferase family protein [Candidatus Eisenbacteria bacterium]|nr:CDP-alcohol phosphatidyltransferase family protein [Candidatus Eisenbacteria bacterium]
MNDRPAAASGRPADAQRQATFVLTRFERWALPRIAASLPRWILPDHLTALGVFGATLIAAGYLCTRWTPAWLWVVNLGLVIHWLGDSLDGTLARVRKHERPRYGFYLDHLTDAYATIVIGIGLGFSPYMLLSVSMSLVIAYLVLSINVYLETHVFGVFRYGYGIVGPTEARVVLLLMNLLALVVGPLAFEAAGVGFTLFDVVGVLLALGMIALLLTRAGRNLATLGRAEPPATPRRD